MSIWSLKLSSFYILQNSIIVINYFLLCFTVTWKRLVLLWLGHRRRSSAALKLLKHSLRMVQFQCKVQEGCEKWRCSIILRMMEMMETPVKAPSLIRHSVISPNALKWNWKSLYFPLSFYRWVGGWVHFVL